MSEYNWTKFKRKAYIKAPLKDIFDAWTKPHNITTWLLYQYLNYIVPQN